MEVKSAPHVRTRSNADSVHSAATRASDNDGDNDGEAGTTAATVPYGSDARNLAMLFALYFVHCLPLAFSWSTMPILLREQASYLAVGSFVLTQYPYSLKILWAPIVEAYWLPVLGRRRSWLVPSFLANAALLFWLALHQDDLIRRIAGGSSAAMWSLLGAWTALGFSCANIRVALDAWALELVSAPRLHWFGTTVTMGEAVATFLSFNLFLVLSSLQASGDKENASVRGFFTAMSAVSGATACLVLLKREARGGGGGDEQQRASWGAVRQAYATILRILRLRQTWTLFAVHMVSLVGFITNDTVTVLQLVKNGFADREIGALATITFPVSLVAGVLVAKLFRARHPLVVWRALFPVRLGAALVAQGGVLLVSLLRAHPARFYIAVLPDVMTTTLDVLMFVCLITYHAEVSDPRHGAVYLPLLATTLDLRYAVLQFISTKVIGVLDGGEDLKHPTRLIDGYQIVNAVGVGIAVPLFWWYLRPATRWLQSLGAESWRVDQDRGGYEVLGLEDVVDDEVSK